MKIIISHDVDHLFGSDHWLRDFIYPKLWVRSTIQLIKRKITFREWGLRCLNCFQRERNCIEKLMVFDRTHNIKSTFFFGMEKGLGMSYSKNEAKPMIQMVHNNGFDTGVHGICYDSLNGMQKEYNDFVELMGYEPCGIRMHYVRFNDETFNMLAKVGYAFDTTEFDKLNNGTMKQPYRVGSMIEFPLTIMDGYLPEGLENKKSATIKKLEYCKEHNIEYISVLFHDYQFCDAYSEIRDWYIWLINHLENSSEYSFISYCDVIKDLQQ